MNCLFIGGVADGEHRNVPDDLMEYRVAKMPPLTMVSIEEITKAGLYSDEIVVYERHRLRCETTVFSFFVLRGIPITIAISMLFDRYRWGNKE